MSNVAVRFETDDHIITGTCERLTIEADEDFDIHDVLDMKVYSNPQYKFGGTFDGTYLLTVKEKKMDVEIRKMVEVPAFSHEEINKAAERLGVPAHAEVNLLQVDKKYIEFYWSEQV